MEQVKRYTELFEQVSNKENYKLPTVPFITDNKMEAREMGYAIAYFTGGYEFSELPNGKFKVTSEGYYHYIGA